MMWLSLSNEINIILIMRLWLNDLHYNSAIIEAFNGTFQFKKIIDTLFKEMELVKANFTRAKLLVCHSYYLGSSKAQFLF